MIVACCCMLFGVDCVMFVACCWLLSAGCYC